MLKQLEIKELGIKKIDEFEKLEINSIFVAIKNIIKEKIKLRKKI